MSDSATPWIVARQAPLSKELSSKNAGVVVIFSSRGSSRPRDWTRVSCVYCIGRLILDHWATWEALNYQWVQSQKCARICVCGPEKGLINGGCFPFAFFKRYFRTSASFNSFCFHEKKKKGSKDCQGSTKSLCILLVQRILFCLRFMSVHFYRYYL